MQALLGFGSETRWRRRAGLHLRGFFPYLPGQSGYTKRRRGASPLIAALMRMLAIDTEL